MELMCINFRFYVWKFFIYLLWIWYSFGDLGYSKLKRLSYCFFEVYVDNEGIWCKEKEKLGRKKDYDRNLGV